MFDRLKRPSSKNELKEATLTFTLLLFTQDHFLGFYSFKLKVSILEQMRTKNDNKKTALQTSTSFGKF